MDYQTKNLQGISSCVSFETFGGRFKYEVCEWFDAEDGSPLEFLYNMERSIADNK